MTSLGVVSWWILLCAIGALNVLAWSASALVLKRRHPAMSVERFSARRLQLLLSAGYVFGCAFRCAFPVYDVPRLCLFNSWLSSVVVGRSVATIAELCFVGQWALMLHETSRETGSVTGKIAALALVPLIAVAEACSWYSVLTTSNLGHVAEESIWGLTAALMVAGLLTVWPRSAAPRRPLLVGCCAAGIAYVGFMVMVDVPMYWSRWVADEASGRHYLSIAQGLQDVAGRWVVSHRREDWKSEMAWMSIYFSVAVWISLSLIHAPMPEDCMAARERDRPLPTRQV